MPVATKISLEEFLDLPEHPGVDLEWHDGEVIEVPLPSMRHQLLQKRLAKLLAQAVEPGFEVMVEWGYVLDAAVRRSDVALVSADRLARALDSGVRLFQGAPNLVVEVLSPSDTNIDLDLLRYSCLSEGAQEFWLVNPDLQTVTVFRAGSRDVRIYEREDAVPLARFAASPDAVLPVEAIFAP